MFRLFTIIAFLILALPQFSTAQDLYFVPNQGQWQESFVYKVNHPNATIYIESFGMTLSTARIDLEDEAKTLLLDIPEVVEVTDVESKEKITRPDKLYDLTTLQRECNKYFGYSAKQTLDYAQSLYEKKLITYPRTDSRYLTDDMGRTVEKYVDSFGDDKDEKNFKSLFDSSKVTDHHAIIPTMQSLHFNTGTLQKSEEKYLDEKSGCQPPETSFIGDSIPLKALIPLIFSVIASTVSLS